jgi:ATP-dependent Zn protease
MLSLMNEFGVGRMTAEERRGAAYHEAGHAIVGVKVGRSLSRVEIGLGGDDSKGETTFKDTRRLPPVDELAICLAGKAAETIFSAPLSTRARLRDRYQADQLVEGLSKNEALERKREGYDRACRILKSNEKDVHQLAGELIENGEVDYGDSI